MAAHLDDIGSPAAPDVVPTRIVRSEELSPKEYLALVARDRMAVSHVRIAPPRLGSGSFGRVIVTYSTPRLRPVLPKPSKTR